jgi:outer membrane cobalamin receptor
MTFSHAQLRRMCIGEVMALLLASCSVVFAQEVPPDSTRTYVLDPITVIATQLEVQRSRIPNAVSVVSREDIQQTGETSVLTVINERVPGVFVTERGVLGYGAAQGGAGSITIRGTGGSPNTEILVLTDGRPQMMGLFGHPLPDTYVTSGVDRVEVIRGPASLVHGTNAMGGAINIISRPPEGAGVAGEAGAAYGSFGTSRLEAATAYAMDGSGVRFSLNHYHTNGHRPNSAFTITNGALRGSAHLNDFFTFSADANVSAFRTFDPGTVAAPLSNSWVDITRGSSGVALENHHGPFSGAVKAFFNWGRHDIFDGFHSTDNNVGVLLYQGWTYSGENSLTLGADFKRYGGVAENRTFGADFGSHFVSEVAGYLIIQHDLFPFLRGTAGVRLNHGSTYGDVVIPQAGLSARLDPATTLKFSTGRGFRSPTIRELYLFPAPTPDLQPEEMWNTEVSLLRTFSSLLSVELTGYVTKGSSMIRVEGGLTGLTLRNSGAFQHRGVEATAIVRTGDAWDADLTYGYLDPDEETNANPRHKVFIGVNYHAGMFVAHAGFQYIAILYGADGHQNRLPDYALFDARVTVAVVPGVALYVSAENLLDRPYQILAGYPMPGRTFFTGVRWSP